MKNLDTSNSNQPESLPRRGFLKAISALAITPLVTSCVEGASAEEKEYITSGPDRTMIGRDADLNTAHTNAYRVFVEELGGELKSNGNLKIVGNSFKIELLETNGAYEVIYKVQLQTPGPGEFAHTVIDMRGTIYVQNPGESDGALMRRVQTTNTTKFTKGSDPNGWVNSFVPNTAKRVSYEDEGAYGKSNSNKLFYHEARIVKGSN